MFVVDQLNLVAVRLLCLWIPVLKMVATFLSLPLDFQSASTATVGVLWGYRNQISLVAADSGEREKISENWRFLLLGWILVKKVESLRFALGLVLCMLDFGDFVCLIFYYKFGRFRLNYPTKEKKTWIFSLISLDLKGIIGFARKKK